jgi:selenocysteine lyase/cysteine desulfurase
MNYPLMLTERFTKYSLYFLKNKFGFNFMTNIDNEFPLDSSLIYLNHAAVSPLPKRTVEAVQAFLQENLFQGAKDYPEWQLKEIFLREQLRDLINAPTSNDIALLKNTSEAISTVAYGLDWKKGENVVITNQEFPSNRIVWESLEKYGVITKKALISNTEEPEEVLFKLVDENTRLISVSAVQYASGLKMDLKKIGQFCKERQILFCVDAIQQLGALQFDVQAIQADFVMADGHKWLLAPEGLALFYSTPQAREKLELKQYGWRSVENVSDYDSLSWQLPDSARKFECGSPNMIGIHALSASLSLLLEIGLENIEKLILENTQFLLGLFKQIPDIMILSPQQKERCSGIVIFKHDKKDNNLLFEELKKQNIICAQRGGGIRFSPHFYTSKLQIEQAVEIIK